MIRRLFGKRLAEKDYQALCKGAEVIEKDHDGYKVLRLADGSFLKLFVVKSRFSSARLMPYSTRFARHAMNLRKLGIHTVDIIRCYRIPSIRRTAVHYRPLPGTTLRQALPIMDDARRHKLLEDTGRFIASLHKQGVYFRSAHMGNIVQQPDGTLGLIDIADMRFNHGALNKELRLRNFRHMARYQADVEYLLENDCFISAYMEQANPDVKGITAEEIKRVIQSGKGR